MKLKRHRKTLEDQETRGGFKTEKLKTGKHRNACMEAFWEILLQRWKTLSTAEKIGAITAGLILSGVAVYLATQMASYFVQQFSQADSPIKSREPSTITKKDKATSHTMRLFSAPLAEKRKTAQKSSGLYKKYPEFLEGTTRHTQKQSQELEANMAALHQDLFPFLKANVDKKVILGFGQNHLTNTFSIFNAVAYLKQWQILQPNLNIIFVQETSESSYGEAKQDAQFLKIEFNKIHKAQSDFEKFTAHILSLPERVFRTNPAKYPDERANNMHFSVICTNFAIQAYQFDFMIAEPPQLKLTAEEIDFSETPGTFVIYDPKTNAITDANIDSTKGALWHKERAAIDRSLTNAIHEALKRINGSGIVVVNMGEAHLHGVSILLGKLPHLFLSFHAPENVANKGVYDYYSKLCFKKIQQCPPPIQEISKRKFGVKIHYCAPNVAGTYKKESCLKVFHDVFSAHVKFIEQAPKSYLPKVRDGEFPKKMSDFWPSKTSIEDIDQKFEQEVVQEDKKNRAPHL